MPLDYVYFDLETRRTANDVGGWDKKHEMGISVAVTYSTRTGEYRVFDEEHVQDLIGQLQRADLVIGHNVIDFDYRVLMGFTVLDLVDQLRTLDTLVDLEKLTGRRLKLDDVAGATLGVGKTADGIEAVRWWRAAEELRREGKKEESGAKVLSIAEYCCFDVKVTRMVHEYGCQHGEVFYEEKASHRRQSVTVDWQPPR